VSAVNGKLGYAPQIWFGVKPVRLRLLAAHLEPPDALAFADDGFRNPSTTAFAAVVDYTFGERFDGPWLCAGVEGWKRGIEHRSAPGRAHWSSLVATAGGGYILRVHRTFYVDPWMGAHLTINPQAVRLGDYQYDPPRLVANASVKLGWFWDW
jgi:hypothetical protein